MENQRLFLFVALSVVIMLLYNAWQEQYGPKPVISEISVTPQKVINPDIPSESTAVAVTPNSQVPMAQAIPNAPVIANRENAVTNVTRDKSATEAAIGTSESVVEKNIRVLTDLLDIELSSKGGDITRAALLKYPYELKQPDLKVQLYDNKLPNLMVNQTGVVAKKGYSPSINHYTGFEVEQTDYRLQPGSDRLEVVFTHQDPSGMLITKTLTFKRNSYVVDVSYQLSNNTGNEWVGSIYRQIQRTKPDESNQSRFIYTFTGAVISTPEFKYEKVTLDDMSEWKSEQGFTKGGWAAMSQHYFIGTIIPNPEEFNRYYTNVIDESRYIVGLQSSEFTVANAETKTINSRYYIGSKEQSRLGKVAPHLDLAVDFGV